MMNRNAANLATKLSSLLISSSTYSNEDWSIAGASARPAGHEVVLRESVAQKEFIITVYERSTAPALEAIVSPNETVPTAGQIDDGVF